MKLIEVVVLLGAHCISPVQHADAITEVGKVQCAVMVEQDTDTGRVSVTPREAASRPEVAAVLKRIADGSAAGPAPGTLIEPAWAPPGLQQTAPKPAPHRNAKPETAATAPVSAPETDTPPEATPEITSKPAPAPVKRPATQKKKAAPKTKSATRSANQCKGSAAPQWYTTKDGKKKYRCVRAD